MCSPWNSPSTVSGYYSWDKYNSTIGSPCYADHSKIWLEVFPFQSTSRKLSVRLKEWQQFVKSRWFGRWCKPSRLTLECFSAYPNLWLNGPGSVQFMLGSLSHMIRCCCCQHPVTIEKQCLKRRKICWKSDGFTLKLYRVLYCDFLFQLVTWSMPHS